MSHFFEHYYLIHVSACIWARVGCCAGCQSTSCFPNHLSNTFESSHWPMCLYFHSNSSPAQHSQIGHPLPSPAKQTKTRNKTLPKHGGILSKLSPTYEYLWILYAFVFVFVLVEENICMWSRADQCFKNTTSSAEFFYDDVHPAPGPRTSRWEFKCSNKCSDVTYPPCHHSCDTQQKPCVMLTVSSINPAWDHFK